MGSSAKRVLIVGLLGCVSVCALTIGTTPGLVMRAVARKLPGSPTAARSRSRTLHATWSTHQIGPGTVLYRLTRRDGDGWLRAYVLRVDLADPHVRVGLLYPGTIAAVQPLSAMARRAGAFAAVNGDFFNIGASGAPIGPVVSGGRLVKGPERRRELAAGLGADGIGRIARVWLQGSVTLPGRRLRLSDLNDASRGPRPILNPNGIALFTSQWGAYPRAGAVRGLRPVTEVLLRHGRVARVRHRPGTGRIARDSDILLGAGNDARLLARLRAGQQVSISYHQQTSAPVPFRFAIGAKYELLDHGAIDPNLPHTLGESRTAIGFTGVGRLMYLVATAGPQRGIPGLSLARLARFMRSLGISQAVSLDDGGSTTIVARPNPSGPLRLLNDPADGSERAVANGIGLFTARAPLAEHLTSAGQTGRHESS